jgi:hypothetical protein
MLRGWILFGRDKRTMILIFSRRAARGNDGKNRPRGYLQQEERRCVAGVAHMFERVQRVRVAGLGQQDGALLARAPPPRRVGGHGDREGLEEQTHPPLERPLAHIVGVLHVLRKLLGHERQPTPPSAPAAPAIAASGNRRSMHLFNRNEQLLFQTNDLVFGFEIDH